MSPCMMIDVIQTCTSGPDDLAPGSPPTDTYRNGSRSKHQSLMQNMPEQLGEKAAAADVNAKARGDRDASAASAASYHCCRSCSQVLRDGK